MILLACLLLVGNKNLAYAKGIEESLFSETKKEKGSIAIQALEEESRKRLEGVQFTVIKIGTLQDGSYELLPEYASTEINLNELKNAEEMEKVWKEQGQEEKGKTLDANGKMTENNLDVGVYLLSAKETEQSDLVSPTLVSVPVFQDGKMNYDITVEPKHMKRPPEKVAPQTGLIPIETMLLFAGGALLCTAMLIGVNRRKSDEKK